MLGCVGIAVLDKLFQVDALPTGGGKFVAQGYCEIGGGPAATAACAIARLGHAVQLIARVGDDSTGRSIVAELDQFGVDTRWVRVVDGAASALSAVVVDRQGERMIVNYQDRSLDRSTQWMTAIPFETFGAVLADVRWPEGAQAALEAARRHGVPSLLDADVSPDDIRPLVERADHVVFSQPGLARMTGLSDLEQGLRAAQAIAAGKVYVTAGTKGCFWLEGLSWQHEPAVPVAVVDTTGAGDVFHGAMLVGLAETMSPRHAVRFASLVAALKCTRIGGRAGIPCRADVDGALDRQQ